MAVISIFKTVLVITISVAGSISKSLYAVDIRYSI